MLYKILKRAIERGNYQSVEDMEERLSILFSVGQLTAEQYQELMELLKDK